MRIEYKANRSQRTVRDSVGNALVARGIARRVDEPQTAEPETAAPESEQADEISPRTGKPKRRYRRRDMKAED